MSEQEREAMGPLQTSVGEPYLWIDGQIMTVKGIDRLKAEIADLRDAIRLIVSLRKDVEWTTISDCEVDGWLDAIRAVKKEQGVTG